MVPHATILLKENSTFQMRECLYSELRAPNYCHVDLYIYEEMMGGYHFFFLVNEDITFISETFTFMII